MQRKGNIRVRSHVIQNQVSLGVREGCNLFPHFLIRKEDKLAISMNKILENPVYFFVRKNK